ncbi:LysR family transcriptional regulator [Brucella pseudogrignonensis]|uniref:LysR family transcriptional regulator n=1 Tax=Brucella pseudogrignonensis TaxID=419475 RepID=UPI003D98095F
MIGTRQLEVLCAVIELGTTSGAAEALSVSQPAVSNMIRHIEDVAGFSLFKREKGRLVPTSEARHLALEAQHLFAQRKRIDRIIKELRGGTVGQLNVIATPSIGYGLLPRLITAFTQQRSDISLSLEVGSVDDIINWLITGRADLAFSITLPRHSALSIKPIAKGEMVCVLSKDDKLVQPKIINVVDLNDMRHISYGSGTPLGQMIDSVFSRQGVERRYYCEVRHTATALEMVAAGGGAALIDSFGLLGRKRSDIIVRKVAPILPISLHAVTSNLFPTSNLASQFEDFVRTTLNSSVD